MKTLTWTLFALFLTLPAQALEPPQSVGSWHLGGLVMRKYATVRAIKDPKVEGVICHYLFVDKKLSFEDPSDAAIACRRSGPIRFLEPLDLSDEGEVISQEGRDLFFKTFRIRRLVDPKNRTLVYATYTQELIDGSNKVSLSTVVLDPSEALPQSK
ncbi:MAG: CreA family protein [bacterium]|nr:CreA family protein [bacterium]